MNRAIHLLDESRSALEADGSEIVPPSIRAVAVLFLSHGRNAWHSTWVRTYQFGDFFRDGRKVQAAVERRKERGTVFYLRALPGFQIGYGDRKFIITEINSFEPFRNIDLMSARYGLMACNLNSFLDLIAPPSSLWKPTQSVANSVIVQEVTEDFIDLAAYSAIARGKDRRTNPPMGCFERQIIGSFGGVSDWVWVEAGQDRQPISLRWYNRALEALAESRERLGEHFRRYAINTR